MIEFEQVVRYDAVGAGPLWCSSNGVPEKIDVPPCPRCGRARKFEFQVIFTEWGLLAYILGVLLVLVLCGFLPAQAIAVVAHYFPDDDP